MCSADSSGEGSAPSSSARASRAFPYTVSASAGRPAATSERISAPTSPSRKGCSATREESSPVSSRPRPTRRSASIRSSRTAIRSSDSRVTGARKKSEPATSSRAGPRHRSSASRRTRAAVPGSRASAPRPAEASRSKRTTSTASGSTARRYPAGCDSTSTPGRARRSRDTSACRAFVAPAGGSSCQIPSISSSEATTRPGSSASRISRARSRVPPTPTPFPSSPRTSRAPSIEIRMATFCGSARGYRHFVGGRCRKAPEGPGRCRRGRNATGRTGIHAGEEGHVPLPGNPRRGTDRDGPRE